ncbi:MAG TPA: NAD-dependent epimerase/dehydratase family protein, partial [Burkholderiales bacterium]|nr:NAD-dependent epimerase/dehydratase family protein [Burkholderiales bacterium]
MDSRIYVAGDAGLIGSALVRLLRARGCTNIVTRTRAELDLANTRSTDHFFEEQKPEYVLLAAGSVGGIVANRDRPADFLSSNLAIELNVINAAHRAGVRRLILFASSCMYPRETAQPMPESALFSGQPEPTSMGY